MGVIERMRRQKAVLWPFKGYGPSGEVLYDDPELVSCRWDDDTQEFVDEEGTKQTSRAFVYVDRDVALGGVLLLVNPRATTLVEALEEVDDIVTPLNNSGAYAVRQLRKNPTFRATNFLRTCVL